MTQKELAALLLPNVEHTREYYEELYPERNLPEGTMVTRFAPSPTGFVHMGAIYTSYINAKMAHQSGGIFFLRIEDTDQARKVENGVENILSDLDDFGIVPDEGVTLDGEKGSYGPYIQSKRKDIYQAFAKDLIEKGLAYPCFLSKEEMDEIRDGQERVKARIGIYGEWARSRYLTTEQILEKINAGIPYIIRIKSNGNFNHKITIKDCVKGNIEIPENDIDTVIIKSDGLPTYHFAHAVDDYLMHTTHVIRSDEWVSSLPVHIELFKILGVKPPKYAHIAPISKLENGNHRKLSKRKDPEAAVSYYSQLGIPKEAVKIYLATVANSNFERWFETNPKADINDFKMEFSKMSKSDSLFDQEKLYNISRNYISKLPATQVYESALEYASKYDSELEELLKKHKDFSIALYNIERERKKPRKDYVMYSDIKNQTWYMYDELYDPEKVEYEFGRIHDPEEIKKILSLYLEKYYDANDDESTWFNRMKDLSEELGYASDMKAYRENPDAYKGNVADVSIVLRVALTSKAQTPNLYDLMQLLGLDRMTKRFNYFITQ